MMYADYIKELEGYETMEHESGFATYIIKDKDCYLRDIYVVPAMRQGHIAKEMTDAIVRQAKDKGCTRLIGTVAPQFNDCEYRILALIRYGFKLHSAGPQGLIFTKEI